MTKQNRFYLLIAALSATMASSDATAVDCSDYGPFSEEMQGIVDNITSPGGRQYEIDNDWGDLGFCDEYNCEGTGSSCSEGCNVDEANGDCQCTNVVYDNVADYVCGGDSECLQCLSGDGDDIGGSGGPSCSSGQWYNGSTCKTCDSHHGVSASSNGGSGDEYSCYIPKGRIFTDTKGTGSFVTNCYYTDD